jgi:hypothetical protein
MARGTRLIALISGATVSGLAAAALASAVSTPTALAPQLVKAHQVAAPEPVLLRHFPAASPKAAAPKPKPKPVVHHVAPRTVRATTAPAPVVKRTTTASLTPQQRMMHAVARIPGYHTGEAVWAITPGLGSWGLAEMGGGVAYISPTVPSNRMYDVVAHEWSHLLTAKVYGNDISTALAAMNAYFGGSGLTGAERAADCMARELGATWTHYTPCSNSTWRAGAHRLLSRQKL